MASLRPCLILATGLPLAIAGGCTSTGSTDSAWASPGAMYSPQDENYEIKGKPETGGGTQAGFGGPGGEVNPQSLEAAAIAPQVHYHTHVHHHYHTSGGTYTVPGYAHASYMVPHHALMPAYTSPYAHSPNGGNSPVGPQGVGPWNTGGYYNHGAWGGGMPRYNPWINNGTGGMEGVDE